MKISELVETLKKIEMEYGSDTQIYKFCGTCIKDFFSKDIDILKADEFEKYAKAGQIIDGHIKGWGNWYIMRNFNTLPKKGENFIII